MIQFPKIFKNIEKSLEFKIVVPFQKTKDETLKKISNEINNIPKSTKYGLIENIIKIINISNGVFTDNGKTEHIVTLYVSLISPKYGDLLMDCEITEITSSIINANYKKIIEIGIPSNTIKDDPIKYHNVYKIGDKIDIYVLQESYLFKQNKIYLIGQPFYVFDMQNKFRNLNIYESKDISIFGGEQKKEKEIKNKKIKIENPIFPYDNILEKYKDNALIKEIETIFNIDIKKMPILKNIPNEHKDFILICPLKELKSTYIKLSSSYKNVQLYYPKCSKNFDILLKCNEYGTTSEKTKNLNEFIIDKFIINIKNYKKNLKEYLNNKKKYDYKIIKEFKNKYQNEWEHMVQRSI